MYDVFQQPMEKHTAGIQLDPNMLDIAEDGVAIMCKSPHKMMYPSWAPGLPNSLPEIYRVRLASRALSHLANIPLHQHLHMNHVCGPDQEHSFFIKVPRHKITVLITNWYTQDGSRICRAESLSYQHGIPLICDGVDEFRHFSK